MAELLPCPFCNTQARAIADMSSNRRSYWTSIVECGNPDCAASSGPARTEDAAIAKWNRRVIAARIAAAVAAERARAEPGEPAK